MVCPQKSFAPAAGSPPAVPRRSPSIPCPVRFRAGRGRVRFWLSRPRSAAVPARKTAPGGRFGPRPPRGNVKRTGQSKDAEKRGRDKKTGRFRDPESPKNLPDARAIKPFAVYRISPFTESRRSPNPPPPSSPRPTSVGRGFARGRESRAPEKRGESLRRTKNSKRMTNAPLNNVP
jgi:hypothetical protein